MRTPLLRRRREARNRKRWDEHPEDPGNRDRKLRAEQTMTAHDARPSKARRARAQSRFDLDPRDDRCYSGSFGPAYPTGI